jgi:hypothetical protein
LCGDKLCISSSLSMVQASTVRRKSRLGLTMVLVILPTTTSARLRSACS